MISIFFGALYIGRKCVGAPRDLSRLFWNVLEGTCHMFCT